MWSKDHPLGLQLCSCGYTPTDRMDDIQHMLTCQNFATARKLLPQRPYFELGLVVATPAALDCLSTERVYQLLYRHATGDWGDLGWEDKAQNHTGLVRGRRVLSRYKVEGGHIIYVITEGDRRLTTLLEVSEC